MVLHYNTVKDKLRFCPALVKPQPGYIPLGIYDPKSNTIISELVMTLFGAFTAILLKGVTEIIC